MDYVSMENAGKLRERLRSEIRVTVLFQLILDPS